MASVAVATTNRRLNSVPPRRYSFNEHSGLFSICQMADLTCRRGLGVANGLFLGNRLARVGGGRSPEKRDRDSEHQADGRTDDHRVAAAARRRLGRERTRYELALLHVLGEGE